MTTFQALRNILRPCLKIRSLGAPYIHIVFCQRVRQFNLVNFFNTFCKTNLEMKFRSVAQITWRMAFAWPKCTMSKLKNQEIWQCSKWHVYLFRCHPQKKPSIGKLAWKFRYILAIFTARFYLAFRPSVSVII